MVRLLPLLLVCAAVVHELAAQSAFSMSSLRRPSRRRRPNLKKLFDCKLRNDEYNPFYWKGQENICSDKLCQENPLLHCNVTREYIMDQAVAHQPEDIPTEIEFMEKYFHTFFPKPRNVLPYSCKGVCEMGDKKYPRDPSQVTRVFADLEQEIGYTGQYKVKRVLCHIIGPKIFSHQCGGPCKIPFGFRDQGNLKCVPTSQVTVEAWAFCPGTYPACHKIPVTVPLSCTCQKVTCSKKLPKFKPFVPKLPDLKDPTLNPFEVSGDPFAPQPDQFGPDLFGPGPFGPQIDPFGPNDPWGMNPSSDPFASTGPLGPALPVDLSQAGFAQPGFGAAQSVGHNLASVAHGVKKGSAHHGTKTGPVPGHTGTGLAPLPVDLSQADFAQTDFGPAQIAALSEAALHPVNKGAASGQGLIGTGIDTSLLGTFPMTGSGPVHRAAKASSSMGKVQIHNVH